MERLKSPNSGTHPVHAIPPCLLLFVSGSIFALGVFTVPIEQASKHASLVDVWPSSMGLMLFLSSPVMMLAGVYLHVHDAQKKTYRIRTLSLLSSLAFSALALAALATKHAVPWLLRLSVALLCLPLGINYLLCTEVLIARFSSAQGFIVGCALVAYNLGDIILSWAFNRVTHSVGVINALYISAFTLSISSVLLSTTLSWPTLGDSSELDKDDNEELPLLSTHTHVKLPWSTLWKIPAFWSYIVIIFAGGAPYAFTPFFFKLVHVFRRSSSLGVTIYQMIGIGGTVVGLFTGWATDVFHLRNGYFSSGAKNVAIITMLTQTVLFAALVPMSQHNNFWGCILAQGTLLELMSCLNSIAAVMARDLFGEVNGCLVFGVGAGLAVGTGGGLSAWIMSVVEESVVRENGESVPGSYVPFYKIGVVWSLIGLAATVVVDKCEHAIDRKKGLIGSSGIS